MQMSQILFLLSLFAVVYLRASNEPCSVNQWCSSDIHSLDSEYKFIVGTQSERISWFDALQLCRNEGDGAELFSLESAAEREWLHTQLIAFNSFKTARFKTEEHKDDIQVRVNDTTASSSLWLVNAHLHLYNVKAPAWASGRFVNVSLDPETALPILYTSPIINCSDISRALLEKAKATGLYMPIINKANAECFAIHIEHKNLKDEQMVLVNLQCAAVRVFRAICKRPLHQNVNASRGLFKPTHSFNASYWIISPTDHTLYYRIIDIKNECNKSNWYCARLLCLKHEATLANIESYEELQWLRQQIATNYYKDWTLTGRVFFVDMHRLLYNTSTWTWGNSPKMHSFLMNLPEEVPQDPCEQQLCTRIIDKSNPLYDARLGQTYCDDTQWNARAVCMKRLAIKMTNFPRNIEALTDINTRYGDGQIHDSTMKSNEVTKNELYE